jgi:hypothetical protein
LQIFQTFFWGKKKPGGMLHPSGFQPLQVVNLTWRTSLSCAAYGFRQWPMKAGKQYNNRIFAAVKSGHEKTARPGEEGEEGERKEERVPGRAAMGLQ